MQAGTTASPNLPLPASDESKPPPSPGTVHLRGREREREIERRGRDMHLLTWHAPSTAAQATSLHQSPSEHVPAPCPRLYSPSGGTPGPCPRTTAGRRAPEVTRSRVEGARSCSINGKAQAAHLTREFVDPCSRPMWGEKGAVHSLGGRRE